MSRVVGVVLAKQGSKPSGARAPAGEDVYLAVDVSRSKWVYGVRWGGQDRRCVSSPSGLHHLQALVEEYRDCTLHVVYEACGFGYELAWWLEGQAIDVMVIAPSRVARVPGSGVKTDRVDVRAMARKREQGQLQGIYLPRRREHERRQLSRTYAQALKECKRARVRIRSLLQEQGRIGPLPKAGWASYEKWLATQDLPAAVALCVEELLALRSAARASAARLQRVLLKLAAEPEYAPIVQAMAAQPGVGTFTAIRLVLELGQMTRFPTAGSIVNYLGLTPSQYSSGDIDHRGHLLKCGPGYLRAWLLQCAWASLRGPHADPGLRQCFEQLRPRVGKKRAIVAVARRLALRLRARWRETVPLPAPAAA